MMDAAFEVRLERAARHYAEEAVRPFDAVALAEAAMRGTAPSRTDASRARWTRARGALAAVATLVIAAAGVGFLLRLSATVGTPSPSPSPSPTPTLSPSVTQPQE